MSSAPSRPDLLPAAGDPPRSASLGPFDDATLADFARLRSAQVALFAQHMRLEAAFPSVEPPGRDFDKRAFCEHFPSAFRDAEADVTRLNQGMQEVTALMAGISRRLEAADGEGDELPHEGQYWDTSGASGGGGGGSGGGGGGGGGGASAWQRVGTGVSGAGAAGAVAGAVAGEVAGAVAGTGTAGAGSSAG